MSCVEKVMKVFTSRKMRGMSLFFAIDFADSKSYSYGGRILNFICRKLLYRLRRIRLCTKNRCLGCTSRDTSIYTITRKFGDFFDKSHCTAPPTTMQYMKI